MYYLILALAIGFSLPAFAQPQDYEDEGVPAYAETHDDYGGAYDDYSDNGDSIGSAPPEHVEYQKSDTGNPLFDLFADKTNRQSTRAKEKANNRVDNETDSYIDRKVKGLMDSLFGE